MKIYFEKNIPCKIILTAILLFCFINQGCTGEKDSVFLSHDFTKKAAKSVFQIADYWDFGKCAGYVGKGWAAPRKDENGEHFVVSKEEKAGLTLYAVEKKDLTVTMRYRPVKANSLRRRVTISIRGTQLATFDMKAGTEITSCSFLIPGENLVLGRNVLAFSFEADTPEAPLKKKVHPRKIAIRLYDIAFNGNPNKSYIFNDCARGRTSHIAYISRFTLKGGQKIGIAQHPGSSVLFNKCYIPPNSVLKFHLGLHPRVKEFDTDVTFSVFVNEFMGAGSKRGTIVFSETLNLKQLKNNPWKSFETDLSEFAGNVLSFSFNIRADADPYTVLVMWGEPRVVSRQTEPKYNVVLITMDALRADHAGCYGYHKKLTPNLDRFSKDAVVYKKCYSPVPWTLPSFASFYTSLYPQTHNVRKNKAGPKTPDYAPLGRRFPTPPVFFKPYNYSTHLITWHPFFKETHGLSRDFDFIDTDDVNRHIPFHIDTVEKWIKWVGKDKFFLHIHIIPPHCPLIAVSPYDETHIDFLNPSLENTNLKFYYSPNITNLDKWGKGPESPDIRNHISALYKANVALSDEFFGKVIRRLKESGVYENSLIIFSSDHGEQLWEHDMLGHGHSLHVEELHVPLLIKFPGDLNISPREVKSPVSTIDILPTMMEVNNMSKPGYFHGRSLFNLQTGKLEPVEREYLYLSQARPKGKYEGVMWHDYKYIRSPVRGTEELYKISTDPFEKNNIAAKKPKVLIKLRNVLKKFSPGTHKTVRKGKKEGGIDQADEKKLKTLGYL